MSLAIPKDSLVLVTGCNGFIGSNTVDHFLEAGYRVRGTTRNVSKIQGLNALWEKKYGKGRFEVATVTDMGKEGAFDEAVQGVSAIVHVASILTFDPDPNKVIPGVIASVNGILKSAAKEPSVKRFVYTSSSTAASEPFPGKVFKMDSNTWNDKQVKEAWAPPPIKPERAWAVYGASKTEGERAMWDFVQNEKPHFVANAVLPNCNFGRALDPSLPLSTGGWARALYLKGEKQDLPAQWFVDVEDTGRLHVAAAIYSDVANERIFAFAEPFNWNDVLRAFRKLRPDHKVIDDYVSDDEKDKDLSIVDNARAIELLKRLGRPGFISLQDSLKNAIEDL